MEEPIDAVALGLKRGPRGAVALVLLVAIALAIVAVRSVEHAPSSTPLPAAEESPVVVAPAPPRSRMKSTAKPQTKVSASGVRGASTRPVRESAAANGVREVSSAPSTRAESVAPEGERPSSRAEEVAKAPADEPAVVTRELSSPPAPASESSPARLMEEEEVAPPTPRPEPEEIALPERDGNGEAIARAIAAEKRAAVRACFESELKQSPKLHGTVVVELDLAPPNRVNGVRVNDDLQRAAFTSCVAATMRDVRFAALDEEISVSVPYVLTPATK